MTPGDIIFLSASVPHRDPWKRDARPTEIEEAIICIARAVFARGGRLLFGGHPAISPLVASVAGEYFAIDPARSVRPIVTFQSEFFRGSVPDRTWDMVRMGWSAIEWTPAVLDDRARSLAIMRNWMLLGADTPRDIIDRNELRPPRAMVAVGGMEGVRDEAAMFLRHRAEWPGAHRVYAFRSGGGAAARLLEPETWGARLWLDQTPDGRDFETLDKAAHEGEVRDVERQWWRENGGETPQLPVQPYAAMAQWLIDTQLGSIG
jgi:hypothetical protein